MSVESDAPLAMSDELTFRPLMEQDLAGVAALNDAEVPRVSPLGVEGLRELLHRCELAWVALDGGSTVVGFVLALAPGADYASVNYRWFEARGVGHLYIDRVVVAPSVRRSGVAGVLYDVAEAHARATGRREVTCEVNVRPPNGPSLAFHARRGFVEVGRQDTTGETLTVALQALPLGPG